MATQENDENNPEVIQSAPGFLTITWYGTSRVPNKVADKPVQYMRDGTLMFNDLSSGTYKRTKDGEVIKQGETYRDTIYLNQIEVVMSNEENPVIPKPPTHE